MPGTILIEKAKKEIIGERRNIENTQVAKETIGLKHEALIRQQIATSKDTNRLLSLLIKTLESNGSDNPHFMGPNSIQAHKIVQTYDY
tara:strand:+ start:1728 stop:1991 length:264 start_codon:yes stop_codon:yes gene_type:complete